ERFFHLSCDFFSITDEYNFTVYESPNFKSSTIFPSYVIPQSFSSVYLGFKNNYFDMTLFSRDNLFFYYPYKTGYVEFFVKRKKFILTTYDKLASYPSDYIFLDKDIFIYED